MAIEYLKDSYKRKLWVVAALNFVLFWTVIISNVDLSTFFASLKGMSIENGFIGSITPIVVFVLDALWSPTAKARIVYWRWRHPLPGSRAFTVHLYKEHRADPNCLMQNWGTFPEDPIGQNRLWYRIFEHFNAENRVLEAHRSWLYLRDLTALVFLFLICFGTAAAFTDASWTIYGWYLVALTVQYTVVMIAAHIQGVRFVKQVLVIASQPR